MRPVRKTVPEEKIRKPAVCRSGFVIEDKIYPLYSGDFHYWRHPRELWASILDNVRQMGFQTICTYVPWGIHEVERGKFDYTGNRDLPAFLTLCAEKELRVLLRPGPHINSELSLFGYPERIIYDPEIMAVNSLGVPVLLAFASKHFPVPSYASEKFYREAALYFDSLIPLVKNFVYPSGPVIGMQSDNETSYFFKAAATYELDYHPDSIRLYRKLLKDLYGDVENLNRRYGSRYAAFDEIEPPRDFRAKKKADMPYHIDWGRYKDYQLKYAIERVAEMFRERGIKELPIYHNYPFGNEYPFDIPGSEELPEIAVAGLDHYGRREKYPELKIKAKFLSGSSRLPFMPEFTSGLWLSLYDAFPPEEEEFITLAAFMHGIRAINFYMLVERERWTGSPITRDNRVRAGFFEMYRRLNKFLFASRLHQYKKKIEAVVLYNYDLERVLSVSRRWLAEGHLLPEELQVVKTDFNLADECLEARRWAEAAAAALAAAGIDYDLANTRVSAERLGNFKYVFLPTASFISEEVIEKLKKYVRRGGRVIMGPRECQFDEYLRRGKHLKASAGIELVEPAALDAVVAGLDVKPEFRVDDRQTDVTVFEREERRIIFVANPTDDEKNVRLSFLGRKTFKDLLDGGEKEGLSAMVLNLRPWQIKVLGTETEV